MICAIRAQKTDIPNLTNDGSLVSNPMLTYLNYVLCQCLGNLEHIYHCYVCVSRFRDLKQPFLCSQFYESSMVALLLSSLAEL